MEIETVEQGWYSLLNRVPSRCVWLRLRSTIYADKIRHYSYYMFACFIPPYVSYGATKMQRHAKKWSYVRTLSLATLKQLLSTVCVWSWPRCTVAYVILPLAIRGTLTVLFRSSAVLQRTISEPPCPAFDVGFSRARLLLDPAQISAQNIGQFEDINL